MDDSKKSVETILESSSKDELETLLENPVESVPVGSFRIPSQITTGTTIRVSSRIFERKKRALEKSLESESTISLENEEKHAKQTEKADNEDIVTEDSEGSSEDEEAASEEEDSDSDSQADGPQRKVVIEIGNTLKKVLEQDYYLINNKNKLAVLPAQPTVISILESWVLHYSTTLLNEKPAKRQKNSEASSILNKGIVAINLCREMADGIRVYFDYTLAGLLLYGVERDQCASMMLMAKAIAVSVALEETITLENDVVEPDYTTKGEPVQHESPPSENKGEDQEKEVEAEKVSTVTSKKRTLRSFCVNSAENPKLVQKKTEEQLVQHELASLGIKDEDKENEAEVEKAPTISGAKRALRSSRVNFAEEPKLLEEKKEGFVQRKSPPFERKDEDKSKEAGAETTSTVKRTLRSSHLSFAEEPKLVEEEAEKELVQCESPSSEKKDGDKENAAEDEKFSTISSTKRTSRSSRSSSAEKSELSKLDEEIKQKTQDASSSRSSASTSPRRSSRRSIALKIHSDQVNELLENAKKWRLVQDDKRKTSMPSNTYGAIHLARLFVRLPWLLGKTTLPGPQLKVILKYIDMFLSFLESHEEWFGEQFYTLRTSFKESNVN